MYKCTASTEAAPEQYRQCPPFHSSGKPQLQACLLHAHKQVAAVINQEHHCDELAWADLCVDADKVGWKLAGSQAVTTARLARSAGTAVASRSHLEAGFIAVSADLSPPGSEGRLSDVWTRIGPPTGIAILSAYLWHSEVLSLRSRELILTATARAKYFGCL